MATKLLYPIQLDSQLIVTCCTSYQEVQVVTLDLEIALNARARAWHPGQADSNECITRLSTRMSMNSDNLSIPEYFLIKHGLVARVSRAVAPIPDACGPFAALSVRVLLAAPPFVELQ